MVTFRLKQAARHSDWLVQDPSGGEYAQANISGHGREKMAIANVGKQADRK